MSQSHFSPSPASSFSPSIGSPISFVLSLVAIVLMIPISAAAQQDVHASLVPKAERKNAPPFHLVSSDGKTDQLSDFKGKIVLLNFWSTGCGGCVLEIPSFIEIQRKYGNRHFTAVGISADIPYEGLKSPEEAWQKVHPFIVKHQVNYPIVMGDKAIISAYGFESYPATYLIDRLGHIAATYVGVVSKEDVESNIAKLLAER